MTLSPIALNGRFSGTSQPTGTQTAAFGLFDAIVRSQRNRSIIAFVDPRFPGIDKWLELPLVNVVPVPFLDWSRARAQAWEQFILPILCRKWGCELVHHPINSCPRWHRGVKSIVTLHDLNVYLHPDWYSLSFRTMYRVFSLPGLVKAEKVVAISDYVCDQACSFLGLSSNRLKRVYNGVKSLPASDSPQGPLFPVDSAGYILCVGSLQPHKNLPRLIRAYQKLRTEFPNLELWVVGRPQGMFRRQHELKELLGTPGIRTLGYLSDLELSAAYRHARVFCYPSLEEGFGLPLLEAMQAGTLVVTSKTSCLPEIAGPAAEFVDPYNVDDIASGIQKVFMLSDQERERRTEEGRNWSLKFTWQKAAQEYLEVYEEVLNSDLVNE